MNYKRQPWTNATGTFAGHAAHVRRNVGLEDEASQQFPYTVLVSLAYTERSPTGQPCDEDELCRLDETEELIGDAMESRLGALFALCVTSDGTRDLFFFVSEMPTDARIEQLIESIEPRVKYSFERLHDPEWHPYWSLSGAT